MDAQGSRPQPLALTTVWLSDKAGPSGSRVTRKHPCSGHQGLHWLLLISRPPRTAQLLPTTVWNPRPQAWASASLLPKAADRGCVAPSANMTLTASLTCPALGLPGPQSGYFLLHLHKLNQH